jgi:hypothetical protein
MDHLSRYKIILSFCLILLGVSPSVFSQSRSAAKTPLGSIAGRVTINGKGAAGIVIGIRTPTFSLPPVPATKGTTDEDGNYRIAGLAAGNYQISPIAPAYVVVSSEATPVRMRTKTVLLGDGENVTGIDFSLARGAVITGKVIDGDGKPVVEERVQALLEDQARQSGQPFQPAVNTSFLTDDRGIYRIYGVPAGRYRVAVGQGDDVPYAGARVGRAAYKRTFYPEATDANAAEIIELTEGSEATNINITVGKTLPSFAVSGRVVDAQAGQPMAGLRFALRRMMQNGVGPMNFSSASNSQGEFRIDSVTPGSYAVVLANQPGTELRADPVPFEVVDKDVSGLVVTASQGQSISGSVFIENATDKNSYAKLMESRLSAFVRVRGSIPGPAGDSALNSDGTFRIGGLAPGRANFFLSNRERGQAPLFTVLRVELNGVVQPGGIEIKNGEDVNGVRVVVSYGSATIRGQVKFQNGELPDTARAYVWLKKVGDTQSSNSRPTNLDARGHFLMEGVPAGSYEVNVNTNLPGRRTVTAKQLITVAEGASADVEITVDLKPPDPSEIPKP